MEMEIDWTLRKASKASFDRHGSGTNREKKARKKRKKKEGGGGGGRARKMTRNYYRTVGMSLGRKTHARKCWKWLVRRLYPAKG